MWGAPGLTIVQNISGCFNLCCKSGAVQHKGLQAQPLAYIGQAPADLGLSFSLSFSLMYETSSVFLQQQLVGLLRFRMVTPCSGLVWWSYCCVSECRLKAETEDTYDIWLGNICTPALSSLVVNIQKMEVWKLLSIPIPLCQQILIKAGWIVHWEHISLLSWPFLSCRSPATSLNTAVSIWLLNDVFNWRLIKVNVFKLSCNKCITYSSQTWAFFF